MKRHVLDKEWWAKNRPDNYPPPQSEYMMTKAMCRMRRSNIDWYELIPSKIASMQCKWERSKTIIDMRKEGWYYAEIGRQFGITGYRVKCLEEVAKRHQRAHYNRTGVDDYYSRPPVSLYLERHAYWGLDQAKTNKMDRLAKKRASA